MQNKTYNFFIVKSEAHQWKYKNEQKAQVLVIQELGSRQKAWKSLLESVKD